MAAYFSCLLRSFRTYITVLAFPTLSTSVLALPRLHPACADARAKERADSREIMESELSATVGVVRDATIEPTLLRIAHGLGLNPARGTLADG